MTVDGSILFVVSVVVCLLLVTVVPGSRSGRLPAELLAWFEANRRAERLLAELLTPQERDTLESTGFLPVPSPGHPGRVYRIPRHPGQILVEENGWAVFRLCIQPQKRLPPADYVILHKLMIEGDEERYLRTAAIR